MAKQSPIPFWAAQHVPDQTGKTFLITGANSGIGFEAAKALAAKGGKVIMACRNLAKAEEARTAILQAVGAADLDLIELNLADLTSVSACADQLNQQYERIDVLINNAGIGWIQRQETADGFEMQLGTNHLGHFALTAQLIGLLRKSPDARVVSIASLAHWVGKIHFDDLQPNRKYNGATAYCQSKLANLLFGLELQRQFDNQGVPIRSIIVHPGMSATSLANAALAERHEALMKISERVAPFVAQDPAIGCLPTLYAATSDKVQGGDYIGPKHFFEIFGTPAKARIARHAKDPHIAAQLWSVSESLTGVNYQTALAAT
ncbi:MAG: oxidoreductase [Marinobacter sp.]|uniref:oxidoreductase n=1 Tax=Marinobacter sp. TaxID=50741 RepID=UPI00299E063B|nr:oxidoreductase [Marinobacter sp.]MDX1755738.1 oxidoreductase [Marinobacter sp.]